MSTMTEAEKKDRNDALNNAVRHRLATEKPDDIVEAAKKYLAFLEGDKDNE